MRDFIPQRDPPHPEISEAELCATLDASVLEKLPAVLSGLGVFYLLSAFQAILLPPDIGPSLAVIAATTAATFFFLWALIRHRPIQASGAHPVAALVAGIVLVNSLSRSLLLSEPQQSAHIMMLLIGAGYVFLSVRWLTLVVIVSLASWASVVSLLFSASEWRSFAAVGLVLLSAVLVAVVVHNSRLSTLRQAYRDRLEEQRQKKELQESEERYALAVKGANDGLWYWDLNTDHLYFSSRWAAMLGFAPRELTRKPDEWFDRIHPYYLPGVKKDLSTHLSGQTPQFESKHRIRHRDSSYRWVLTRGLAVRDAQGKPTGIAGSQTDITHLIEVEQRLLHDALHDRLTGLPNRNFLMKQLQTAVASKKLFAVIFLDLNRFKIINDSLGHLVGDQLLEAAADRLRSCQRLGDTVARLGGDEFVVLLNGLRAPEDASKLAARIQEVLSWPFQLEGHQVVTSASIGIALSTGEERPEDLLRNADIAMYHAKARSKRQVQLFNPDMHQRLVSSWHLQNALREAVKLEELVLHYQPLISLRTGKIGGVEALLRWQRGSQLLSPNEFIPLAEEMGIITEIGEWVLRTACSHNAAWQQAGLRPLRVSVNLSARQLKQTNFPETVQRALEESNLDPQWLELELTETALMENLDVAPKSLRALSKKGIRISIDDFGTGYSSLSQLKRFSFDALKIDRSFVADITSEENAASLTKGLIMLAHNLSLQVTAEGVETPEQLAFLRLHGCDYIQGFLASKPVEAGQFAEFLRSDRNIKDFLGEKDATAAVGLEENLLRQ